MNSAGRLNSKRELKWDCSDRMLYFGLLLWRFTDRGRKRRVMTRRPLGGNRAQRAGFGVGAQKKKKKKNMLRHSQPGLSVVTQLRHCVCGEHSNRTGPLYAILRAGGPPAGLFAVSGDCLLSIYVFLRPLRYRGKHPELMPYSAWVLAPAVGSFSRSIISSASHSRAGIAGAGGFLQLASPTRPAQSGANNYPRW